MFSDQLPAIADNRRMVISAQERDPSAMRGLLRVHKGLVAAQAYAFKDQGLKSNTLLMIGARALLRAGLSYNTDNQDEFNNYAAGLIEEAFGTALPHAVTAARENLASSSPMDRVIERVTHLEDPCRPVEPVTGPVTEMFAKLAGALASVRHNRTVEQVEQFDLQTKRVLSLLHLENTEISDITGLSRSKIIKAISLARESLGISSQLSSAPLAENGRVELALMAHEAGLVFDLKPVPPLNHLTTRERMIVARLGKQNTAIAQELGLSKSQVGFSMTSLLEVTGAKTRTELAVMAQVYGFGLMLEPLEERNNPLKEYESAHQLVLENLHLHIDDIVDLTGLSHATAHGVIWRCEEKNGASPDQALNRVQLANELRRRGVKYAIREPKEPLAQALNIKEWKIATSLELSNTEIGESIGETDNYVSGALFVMRNKLGARSRVELALMMQEYDTGERPKEELTRREKLHAKLGVPALSDADINRLVGQLTDLQQKCVSGYYLRKEPISWKALGQELKMRDLTSAHYAAERGLQNMRAVLEAEGRLKPLASVTHPHNVFEIQQSATTDIEAEDERLVA